MLPTIIIKEEDRRPLLEWQHRQNIKIHIWHVFYDMAFGIALDRVEALITNGEIEPTVQTFQAPGGATTRKTIYKVYYHHAYVLGKAQTQPQLVAAYIEDKNGHILPYVRFEGGNLIMEEDAMRILSELAGRDN